ncbi:hypothetical protein QP794_23875 [Paenibacillus sp. UMB7766-LJ446]|uniref:hypothetical protein n=1 Tax=Paenibacillus sp. UMB7766-LJ446 TaxID=3046313 RepID=UPI00254FACC0|nr:hypothetical protein [Paenibacillus sp. UMB7766-LJ446]MDK8193131.1 hypothetical protein [Paenibacillus sp. UMB7766-LJ446]
MELQKKIDSLIHELNFERVTVNGISMLHYNGSYYKISFIKGLNSYVIEFANNYDEAKKNLFEDGDVYPVSLGEDRLISELHHDLNKYYLNK